MTQTNMTLGNIESPAVGFGTYLIEPEAAAAAVAAAIEAGYRHIDTAAGYGNEAGVGEGIRLGASRAGIDPADVFVTTKLWPGNAAWGQPVKGYDETLEAFEESRRALGREVVDLYLIHAPSGGEKRLDEWRALIDIKADGRARAIGVSNFTEAHIDEITDAGLALPEANQIELHPWSQKPGLVAYLRRHGILPIAYSSLVPLSTWRADPGQDSAKTEAMRAEGGEASPFRRMAGALGVTEAQLLLRWGVQSGFPVIPKSLNPDRMRSNADLFGFSIPEEMMQEIATLDRGDGVAWATGDPRELG